MDVFHTAKAQAACLAEASRKHASKPTLLALSICLLTLHGCGGGGNTPDNNATASSTVASPQSVWAQHSEDSLGHAVDLTYTAVITPYADGSYDITRTTQGGAVAPVDGINDTVDNVESYSANGTATRIVYKQSGKPLTCTFDATNTRVVFPLTPGLTWTRSWHKTCDNGVTWTVKVDNGSFVGQESLVMPMGTFSANHARFTETRTSSNLSTPVTVRLYDCWYDAKSNRQLKCEFVTTQHGNSATTATSSASAYITRGTEIMRSATYDVSARTAPKTGVTGVYQHTVIDNSDRTINLMFTVAITKVSTDGGYEVASTTNGGSVAKVGNTDYTVNQVSQYAPNGVELSRTDNGRACSYLTAPQNIVEPISPGMSWSKTWTEQCPEAEYTNILSGGQVLGLESITVPAASTPLNAYKVQYTVTRAPSNSQAGASTSTSARTCWLEASSHKQLKCETNLTRTGTTSSTNGYATQITDVLQSFQ